MKPFFRSPSTPRGKQQQTRANATQAVRIPKELDERLARLARETGCTKSYYARQAIEEWLDEREDDLVALQRLEQVEKGAKTHSLDEVKRELGLDD